MIKKNKRENRKFPVSKQTTVFRLLTYVSVNWAEK